MIEVRKDPTNGEVVKQETPARITTTMIINDLDDGIDRTGIQEKYGLEKWEVTQMFQHPTLKGKKAKKVRKLSFDFVDDSMGDSNQTSIPMSEEEVFTDLDEQSEEMEREMHYTPKETSTAVAREFADGQDETVIEEINFDDEEEEDTDIEY